MADNANLWIGGLPEGIDDESFAQLFEGSGTIVSSRCMPEKKCGFVKYSSRDEAMAVVEAMNGFEFDGTTLQVKFANDGAKGSDKGGKGGKDNSWGGKGKSKGGKDEWGGKGDKGKKGCKGKDGKGKEVQPWEMIQAIQEPSDNLYIKGLPADFSSDAVEEIFGNYATVTSCKLLQYPNECSLLMRVASVDMAKWMVESLDGNIPEGLTTTISVRYADTPATKAKKVQTLLGVAGDFCASKGDGKGKSDKSGPYGGKGGKAPLAGNPDPNLAPHVKAAVDVMLKNFGSGGKGGKFPSEGDETNLYVKDLPGTADDLYIYKVFSPFGALESISIKTGPDGTWAIAFVKYSTNAEAQGALMGLNNCLLPDGSMLKVSVKTGGGDQGGKGGGKGGKKGKKGKQAEKEEDADMGAEDES